MDNLKMQRIISGIPQITFLFYLIRWLFLSLLIGTVIGSVSAFFLTSLNFVTVYRETHLWLVSLLPVAGLLVGLLYHYAGKDVSAGNNLILQEFHTPKRILPLKMAPLILVGTLITHLCGGSAGREGTAVQMGGAIADQFTKLFSLRPRDRKIILVMGISAGFASVFGTPLAGALFAIEVLVLGRMRYEALLPSILVAIIGDYTCSAWHVAHAHYPALEVPLIAPDNLPWVLFSGIVFGLTALLFSKTVHFVGTVFSRRIPYPPMRPFVGGIIIALSVWIMGTTSYIGLGLPVIAEAFESSLPGHVFLLKLLLTCLTLGAGFKGGEVTPLFFIGATLGSALCLIVPLPLPLLAAMGFVAVFAGATNTPIACTIMGLELFGVESGVYIGLACFVSYLFSGHTGIYTSQVIGSPKHLLYGKLKGKSLRDL